MEKLVKKTDNAIPERGIRSSNIELLRILAMVVIVAHHYFVNSGLPYAVASKEVLSATDYFLLLFGWGGKTATNCFVLITGYFMCTADFKMKKFFRLLGEHYFYTIIIWCIFFFSGYEAFSLKEVLNVLFPFLAVKRNFVQCFLLFYLLIPFLNKMIHALNEREHLLLIAWCMGIYVVLPSLAKATVDFNYITWFSVIYILASYIRLYPKKWLDNCRLTGLLALASLLLSWLSIVVIAANSNNIPGIDLRSSYFFISCNKIPAFATSVFAFLFFKNLKIGYSKLINTVAASTFGVLLIHGNSNTMRRWLWQDVCNNVGVYENGNGNVVIHALLCTAAVYIACTGIDMARRAVAKKLMRRNG